MMKQRMMVIYSPLISPLCPRINYLICAKTPVGYFMFNSHISRTPRGIAHFPYRVLRLREVQYKDHGHTAHYSGRIVLAPSPGLFPLSHTKPLPKWSLAARFTGIGGSGPIQSPLSTSVSQ